MFKIKFKKNEKSDKKFKIHREIKKEIKLAST